MIQEAKRKPRRRETTEGERGRVTRTEPSRQSLAPLLLVWCYFATPAQKMAIIVL